MKKIVLLMFTAIYVFICIGVPNVCYALSSTVTNTHASSSLPASVKIIICIALLLVGIISAKLDKYSKDIGIAGGFESKYLNIFLVILIFIYVALRLHFNPQALDWLLH